MSETGSQSKDSSVHRGDEAPDITPERMAESFGPNDLERAMGYFKGYSYIARTGSSSEQRERNRRKAEYWRKVADLVERRNGPPA